MIPQDVCSFLKFLQTQRTCKHKKQRKQIKTKLFFILIQRPMPLCVISVSLVAPVSRMVRMLWLLDQSLNTALNMTLDLRTLTARCPSMKITKNQEVSTNILLKKLLKLLFIDWLIVIIYSYSHFLNLSLRSIWCIWRAASRGVRCAERMWEWTVCAGAGGIHLWLLRWIHTRHVSHGLRGWATAHDHVSHDEGISMWVGLAQVYISVCFLLIIINSM